MSKVSNFSVFSILCCLFLSTFTACDRDNDIEKVNLSLSFNPKYHTESFLLDTRYRATDTSEFSISKLNFLVSPIELINQDNQSIRIDIEDAYFINLENPSTLQVQLVNVPIGNYKGIKLGIGLPANLNSKDPSEFPLTSTLNDLGHYWAAWNSFIFSRLEGNFYTQNINTPYIPFLYHSGIDAAYQSINLYKDFTLTSNNPQHLTINLKVNEILYPADGENIDIIHRNMSHGGNIGTEEYDFSLLSIRNIAKALELQ